MLSTSTIGRPSSASCRVSSSARRRFLASATWTTVASAAPASSLRVTRASSASDSKSFKPGVSTSRTLPLPNRARAETRSTVVPGKFDTVT